MILAEIKSILPGFLRCRSCLHPYLLAVQRWDVRGWPPSKKAFATNTSVITVMSNWQRRLFGRGRKRYYLNTGVTALSTNRIFRSYLKKQTSCFKNKWFAIIYFNHNTYMRWVWCLLLSKDHSFLDYVWRNKWECVSRRYRPFSSVVMFSFDRWLHVRTVSRIVGGRRYFLH